MSAEQKWNNILNHKIVTCSFRPRSVCFVWSFCFLFFFWLSLLCCFFCCPSWPGPSHLSEVEQARIQTSGRGVGVLWPNWHQLSVAREARRLPRRVVNSRALPSGKRGELSECVSRQGAVIGFYGLVPFASIRAEQFEPAHNMAIYFNWPITTFKMTWCFSNLKWDTEITGTWSSFFPPNFYCVICNTLFFIFFCINSFFVLIVFKKKKVKGKKSLIWLRIFHEIPENYDITFSCQINFIYWKICANGLRVNQYYRKSRVLHVK